jgi:pimeloyl-ACP methyl ester carboxylesterase
MATAHVNGVDLYYEIHGHGTPVLGIHGTPSSALLWSDAARVLAEVGACIIYDRRGFHRSERPSTYETTDLAHHVADAAALLDEVATPPAVVIGRSTGGLIALALAVRHPRKVRALVLLEPAVFAVDPATAAWARHLRETVLARAGVQPDAAAQAVFDAALGPAVWESLPAELQEHFAAAGPAVLAEIRGHGLDLSAEPVEFTDADLAAVRQPTLLVSAHDSPDVMRRVNDHLAAALPRSEQATVAGGHLIDPAGPAVKDFVARVSARS